MAFETGGPTFSRTVIALFLIVQIVAIKLLVQKFQDTGLISLPSWVPFIDKANCGHLREYEYVLVGRKVVTPDGVVPAAVCVKDGKITAVRPINGEASLANLTHAAHLLTGLGSILDYGDLIIAPGLIDTHVHMNQPGRTDWEGMETATKAAAAGGITTVIDMPLNNDPATTEARLVEKKIWAARGEIWVDVGLWGGLVPSNAHHPDTLRSMLASGVLGFKCFMSSTGMDDFPLSSIADIRAALPVLKSAGVPLYVHAELALPDDSAGECCAGEALGECSAGEPQNYSAWLSTRPAAMEQAAVRLLVEALEADKTPAEPGFEIHVAHLADAGATLDMLKQAKKKGLPISVETCPHFLLFAAEDIQDGQTQYKCTPPIRSRRNMEGLRKAVVDGHIDSMASDHSPCPPDLKALDAGDFPKAWGGISGLQYGLPGTWEGLQASGLSPEILTSIWSTYPAKLAGLGDRKGALAAGYDADIVVWDPQSLADTSTGHLQHRHKVTAYEDAQLHGRVHATFVRGHQVFSEEQSLTTMVCGEVLLRDKP